jgi:O-6-methylguanine DNA methyltransferase
VTRVRWAPVSTTRGAMLGAVTTQGIAALTSSGSVDEFLATLRARFGDVDAEPDADALRHVGSWVTAFLEGARHDLPEVDLRGLHPFDVRVYRAVRDIPAGSTATYGEIAAAIGSPLAARAVGGAMRRCPLFPAVPCHRVVRAADGFSGWGGPNLTLKRRLLDVERSRPQR